MHPHIVQSVKTWDLENEVVSDRVASPALLNDHTGKKIIVVNGNGSMIVDYQCRSRVRYLLQPVDFITCSTGSGGKNKASQNEMHCLS